MSDLPRPPDSPWRRLSSRTVYRHPFLTVREDRVALPNGREIDYCVATTGASGVAVGVLPFLDESTVLMERQWRYIAGRLTWEMPTGGVDPGEPVEHAAQRELMQEVGHRAAALVPLLVFTSSKSVVDETAHLYLPPDSQPNGCRPTRPSSSSRRRCRSRTSSAWSSGARSWMP